MKVKVPELGMFLAIAMLFNCVHFLQRQFYSLFHLFSLFFFLKFIPQTTWNHLLVLLLSATITKYLKLLNYNEESSFFLILLAIQMHDWVGSTLLFLQIGMLYVNVRVHVIKQTDGFISKKEGGHGKGRGRGAGMPES